MRECVLNSLLKTIKKINLLILITKYCLYFIFLNSCAIYTTCVKIPMFLLCFSIKARFQGFYICICLNR